jgi:hypothetical protein
MFTSHHQNAGLNHKSRNTANETFEKMAKFKYLGTTNKLKLYSWQN